MDAFTQSSGHPSAPWVVPPGRHALVDAEGCECGLLDDAVHVRGALLQAIEAAGVVLLHMHVAQFEPCGVTAVAVLAESHVSVHTWPELGYAAIDAFTCGNTDAAALCDRIAASLGAQSTSKHCIARRRVEGRDE